MRELIVPPEFRDRHDERRAALIESDSPLATERFEVEFLRRDGSRFPGEATVSKVEARARCSSPASSRDVTERVRRQAEREALLREQAARAEAERVAEIVGGMQALVDAALAQRTLDGILRDLVTQVRGVLDADAATIYLADEERAAQRRAPRARRACSRRRGVRRPRRRDARGDARPRRSSRRAVDADRRAAARRGRGHRRAGGGAAPPREFGGEDLTLLRLAAERVGLAIAHARVYEREHRIAETLQRSLLPDRLPELPGLEVAARYLPAASEAEVGGDWYDVIPIAGGAVGLVMGDVAGKGLAGASMVGRLRSALRAYALEGHDGRARRRAAQPAALDRGRGQPDGDDALRGRRPRREPVRWVNAGHPPPLLSSGGEPALPRGRRLGAARRAAVPDLRGGDVARWTRAARCCSTPTA